MRYSADSVSIRSNDQGSRQNGRFEQSLNKEKKGGRTEREAARQERAEARADKLRGRLDKTEARLERLSAKGGSGERLEKVESRTDKLRAKLMAAEERAGSKEVGAPTTPEPERIPPPQATGSYRLGGNEFGGSFLNFDGDGTASIIGAGGTNLKFSSVRTGEDGSIFGERGAGAILGETVDGGVGFKISIAPNDAGYLVELKAEGDLFEAQAVENGIVPPGAGGVPTQPPSRGGGLLFLYSLGPNDLGATGVTLNTDGTGAITGGGVDIALAGGGYDASGDWVATEGFGTVDGQPVTLTANADGNVFVATGEGGLADTVSAWLDNGTEFVADVVAVAQP